MMLVPAALTVVAGVFLLITIYTEDPKVQSGIGTLFEATFRGGLFFLGVIVTAVFLLVGIAQLRKLRKDGKSS